MTTEDKSTGGIVTRIGRNTPAIDNTRIGWPSSSLVSVFNRNGGPSAATALHGDGDGEREGDRDPASRESSEKHQGEVAELIDQAILPLPYTPQAEPGERMLLKPGSADIPPPAEAVSDSAIASQAEVHPIGDQASAPAPRRPSSPSKVVLVEVKPVPGRAGRPRQQEAFPFGTIGVSTKTNGQMIGESFLIPFGEHPDRQLAAARKRHKGRSFVSRKEAGGVRIWRSE